MNTHKIRDYSTITGKFKGASQSKYSIKLNISNKPPLILHNLKGYDGHNIFEELNNFYIDIKWFLIQLTSTWALLLTETLYL